MKDRTLDVARANTKLLERYREAWPRLQSALDGVDKASGPHFVRIPEGYGRLPVRLAVVGQQTQGWDRAASAHEQVGLYPDGGVVDGRRGSPFWRAARQVTDAVTGQPGAPVLWANLVAVDVALKRPPEAVRDAVRGAAPPHGLLQHLFEAARPHAAVLFVGPSGYYGWELRQQFPGLETEPVGGYGSRELERVRHPLLPPVTFRTYHPGYLQRTRRWEMVETLPGLIRSALPAGTA